jgi:hypothetical protein
MATQTATTTGGRIILNENAASFTWDDVRNASTGDIAAPNPTNTFVYAKYVIGGRGSTFNISRTYLAFDLSSVVGTITDLDLVLTLNSGAFNKVIVLASTAPGLATNITTADYGDVDFNTTYSSNFTLVASSTNTITLNSTAKNNANLNGELILGVVDYEYDYLNLQPDPGEIFSLGIQYSSGTAPYLSYTAVTGYGNTVTGVVSANIGEVIGVATADIGKVIGVQ